MSGGQEREILSIQYHTLPASSHQLFPPGKSQTQFLFIASFLLVLRLAPPPPRPPLVPPHSISLSVWGPLNALRLFPLLCRFLLFNISHCVPVVTGSSLPGADRDSHSHSLGAQSISEGDKLSVKLLSLLKLSRKGKQRTGCSTDIGIWFLIK